MAKPGRPRKDDAKTVAEIVKHIEAGAFAHVAASAAGVHRATFYRWLNEDPEFRDKVEAASARARQKAEAAVFRDSPKSWLRYGPGKTRADADGWTDPTRVEISGPGGGPIPTGPDLSKLSTKDLRLLQETLKKAEPDDAGGVGEPM